MTTTKTDFRVREIKRYIVTRYDEGANSGSVVEKGTFPNYDIAYEVAYALAKDEADRLGLEPGDARVQFPMQYGLAVEQGEQAMQDMDLNTVQQAAYVGVIVPAPLSNTYSDVYMLDKMQQLYRDRSLTADEMRAVSKFVHFLREDQKQGSLPL